MKETRKNKKHTIREKLQAVELYKQGLGAKRISSKLSICRKVIDRWLNAYKVKGLSGFNKQSNIRATAEFKQKIVKEVLENHLSYDSVSLIYPVSSTTIYSWVTKVKEHGYSSLMEVKQRGRPPKNMGRPKKKEPETETEKLQAEVEYLRAENAYLKKLRALVEERESRESVRKPKPSNH
jgi:transposase